MIEPDQIARALAERPLRRIPALPGRRNHLRAGVLVPLVWTDDGRLLAISTLRASTLPRHAGEVSFPGGAPAAEDVDLEATALREAREELGIEQTRLLGRLSEMPLYTSDYRLVPFVGELNAAAPFAPSSEVAAVLESDLLAQLAREAIEGIPFRFRGEAGLSPVFRPRDRSGGRRRLMYGATAHTMLELLEVLAPLAGRALPPLRGGELTWAELGIVPHDDR